MQHIPRELDAHQWMRQLRLEYYRVNQLRQLRLGDVFWISFFEGQGVTPDLRGVCECYISRVTGGYSFNAVWTLQWGKPTCAHVMTFGEFALLPGNRIRFASEEDAAAARSFSLVCRYAEYFTRHARAYGIDPLYLGAPYHHHRLWRGTIVLKDGVTSHGILGPEPRGLSAIVDTALALCALDPAMETMDMSFSNPPSHSSHAATAYK